MRWVTMAEQKTPPQAAPVVITAAASPKPMSNEARASKAGTACLQRHGTEFYRHIVAQRWGKE